jgi:hypothetical protein
MMRSGALQFTVLPRRARSLPARSAPLLKLWSARPSQPRQLRRSRLSDRSGIGRGQGGHRSAGFPQAAVPRGKGSVMGGAYKTNPRISLIVTDFIGRNVMPQLRRGVQRTCHPRESGDPA